MKISIDWIKDFVDLPHDISDMELSKRITLGVCEIEGHERIGANFDEVIVAEITNVVPHPNADKLKLATVRLGGEKYATVVCGAPNCRIGLKVPYAAIGTTLPQGLTLEPKKIRGIPSDGMLCAEDELGLSDKHDGLMELAADSKAGDTLARVLGSTSDLILDIDNKSLTHRPDCWGHYGLAREFAAVFKKPLRNKFDTAWAESLKRRIEADGGHPPAIIHVDTDSANRGFLGLSVDGVTVESSPQWMQKRLHAAGMRPINIVVDISNYAMLETGMPNHIFDRTSIHGGKIIVRRAGRDMDFTTLDGQTRALITSDTMVCDTERELAIAGVMGGLETSVTEKTTMVMIEVANWTDAEIRRTGTRLGLRTDASMRYEKSLDSQQLEKCLLRIYELFLQLIPGIRAVGGIQSDNMPEPVDMIIQTSPIRISRLLGKDIDEYLLKEVLESLEFIVERIPGAIAGNLGQGLTHKIHIPTWRSTKDIACEADIVEEIGRIIGYDTIQPESPSHDIRPLRLSSGKILFRKAQDFLVLRSQALEIMTSPLIGLSLLEKASWPLLNENLTLVNAITPEHDRMRSSLIPSLLLATAENCKKHGDFRFFEYGRSYTDLDGEEFSKDHHQIGIVFQASKKNPFIKLTDTIEELLEYLKLPGRVVKANPAKGHALVPATWPGSHPHEFLDVQIMGRSQGIIVSVHPQVARAFKIKGRTSLAVLDFTESMNQPVEDHFSFHPLDRFPSSEFDVTVVMPTTAYAADAVDAVKSLKMNEIRSVGVLDVFDMGEGDKALTLHIEFRDTAKTLNTSFLQDAEGKIIMVLDKAGYPIRS